MSGTAFISTTIPYINARPHVGHAFEYVQADAYARQMAQMGRDVMFLSGSDENSLKNVLAAEKAGLSAREFVDQHVVYFEELIARLGLRVDRFVRTSSDPDHLNGAAEIWNRMRASDDIYAKEYEGLYCVGCEQFYAPADLAGGLCPDHLTAPEVVKERNYFFRLSRYGERLLDAISTGEIRIIPETRRNEVVSFVSSGLEDISISRSMQRARGWGIPVPGDPTQVMYVWIDALTNYINGLGFVREAESFDRYWVSAADRVHVVGKGVARFHTVHWPAMLMSAGLPLPTEIVVHGYITLSGQKQSKSLGNVIDPSATVDQYGLDAVRYFLLADTSPFEDGDFSTERLVARYNTDLANGLGNLVSRVTSMIVKYRDGVVPAGTVFGQPETELADQVKLSVTASVQAMSRRDHREALARIWDLVRRANAYVGDRAPWHLAKSDEPKHAAELETALHHLAAAVRALGWLLLPFLPVSAGKILDAVGASGLDSYSPESWLDGLPGITVAKPETLFPRHLRQ
jgi:methionyl-tRNA synthetase